MVKQETSKQRSLPKNLVALKKLLLVNHPTKMEDMWKHAKKLCPSNPETAFSAICSLKLVGPFEYIDSNKTREVSQNVALVRYRYPTDLPEMQTIMTYTNGRFCYWRDTPSEMEPFLVHVSNTHENFPRMELVGGADPFSALHFLINLERPNSDTLNHWSALFMQKYEAEHFENVLREAERRRKRISIGKPFHGLGISVPMANNIGYRPLGENLKRLKSEMIEMATTDDQSTRQILREKFLSLRTCIDIANDELDFGMGLEFGHNLFHSNYEVFDGLARSVLTQAYRLLKRDEFVDVLQAHYDAGRRNPDNIRQLH